MATDMARKQKVDDLVQANRQNKQNDISSTFGISIERVVWHLLLELRCRQNRSQTGGVLLEVNDFIRPAL